MDKYREKIRKRIIVMAFVLIVLAVIYFMLPLIITELPSIPDFIRGFHMGSFTAIELVLVFYIVRYIVSLRNEGALKKLYIEENDERTKMIMQKSGAIGMEICMAGLAIGTITAGFLDKTVFFSLLGALAFTALVRGLIKVYCCLTM
jgi:uncharacterized membrane protein